MNLNLEPSQMGQLHRTLYFTAGPVQSLGKVFTELSECTRHCSQQLGYSEQSKQRAYLCKAHIAVGKCRRVQPLLLGWSRRPLETQMEEEAALWRAGRAL